MTKVIALDSTLYKRGVVNPYVSPLGVGLVPRDPDATATSLLDGFRELAGRFPGLAARPFWCSVHLFRKCPNIAGLELLDPIIRRVLPTIDVVSVTHSPTRLERIRTHGLTVPRETDRQSFMSDLQQDYVYHSLWKFGQLHDMTQYHAVLDGMNPIVTGGSSRVSTYDFEVVIHGDEVNPLVCAADLFAKFLDVKLASMPDPGGRYPTAPISDETVATTLRGSGVKLFTSIIGTRDFHFVTPLRSGGGPRPLPIRHPIVFAFREPPPSEAGTFPRTGLDAFEELSPPIDYVTNRAIELKGSWKRWDNSDLIRFDDQKDDFVYYGPIGEKLSQWLRTVRPACRTIKFDLGSPSLLPGG